MSAPRGESFTRRCEKIRAKAMSLIELKMEGRAPKDSPDVDTLLRIVEKMTDAAMTHHWSRQLGDAIKKNASTLQHSRGGPLTSKLASMVARTNKALKGDRRVGGKAKISLPPPEIPPMGRAATLPESLPPGE